MSVEEIVEKYAEGVDVGGGRHSFPLHLLRRGEAGCAERMIGSAHERRVAASEPEDESGERIIREMSNAKVGEDVASVWRDGLRS